MLGRRPRLCVEYGSRILHPHDPHDPRPIVNAERYVGVDAYAGPGVDVVMLAHEYHPPEPVDLALSLVALEHDPHWRRTILAISNHLAPDGVFAIVCAGQGAPQHELNESPRPGHYRNVTSAEILLTLEGRGLQSQVLDAETVIGGSRCTRTRVLLWRTS